MLEGATLNIFTGQSISQTKSFTYLNNEMIVSLIEATLDKHQNPEPSTEACRSMELVADWGHQWLGLDSFYTVHDRLRS